MAGLELRLARAGRPGWQLRGGAISLGNRSYIGIDGIALAPAAPVPEAASAALLLAGLGGMAAFIRRRAQPPARRPR